MSTQTVNAVQPLTREGNVFRGTHLSPGRTVFVTPGNSTMAFLCYGRIRLDAGTPRVEFDTGKQETGLICLSGEATVTAGGEAIPLGRLDSVYVPRGTVVSVATNSAVDIAEFSAEVAGDYPLQTVSYAEVARTGSLCFATGGDTSRRTVNILLGKNVAAGRLLVGFTISEPGHWTSWPPHEHAAMLEELYVYSDMPAPAWGLQLVYADTDAPELVTLVREGDAVCMPRGFHPNVAAPGHRIGFLWAMAAHREVEDRVFGVVNVQPGFGGSGSGLEASRK